MEKNWFLALLGFVAMISMFLLVIGAAKDPGSSEIPPSVVANETLTKNMTVVACATNPNTQLYCTAIAFSIICGSCGFGLAAVASFCVWEKRINLNQAVLAVLLAISLCIPVGLWADILALEGSDA